MVGLYEKLLGKRMLILVTFHALFKDIREMSCFILINIQQIKNSV
jgi:hypothetical protein